MLRPILTMMLLLLPWSAIAEPGGLTQTESKTGPLSAETAASRFSAEGELQAHSVAGTSSPWMGVGMSYRFLEVMDFGVRGFVPVAKPVDKSAYSIQGYLRARLVRTGRTEMFFESDYAQNFYDFIPFNSYGFALGVTNRFLPGLSFGVLGGIEVTHEVIDSLGLERENSLVVYPKVALIAGFGL